MIQVQIVKKNLPLMKVVTVVSIPQKNTVTVNTANIVIRNAKSTVTTPESSKVPGTRRKAVEVIGKEIVDHRLPPQTSLMYIP